MYCAPTFEMSREAWRKLPKGDVGLGKMIVTSEEMFAVDTCGYDADLIVADNADHFKDRASFRNSAAPLLVDRNGRLESIEEGEVA